MWSPLPTSAYSEPDTWQGFHEHSLKEGIRFRAICCFISIQNGSVVFDESLGRTMAVGMKEGDGCESNLESKIKQTELR